MPSLGCKTSAVTGPAADIAIDQKIPDVNGEPFPRWPQGRSPHIHHWGLLNQRFAVAERHGGTMEAQSGTGKGKTWKDQQRFEP